MDGLHKQHLRQIPRAGTHPSDRSGPKSSCGSCWEESTMSRGSIQRRGKNSFRIRFEKGVDAKGRRKRHSITFKGSRDEAKRELTRLLAASDTGTLPEPSKLTVAQHLRGWLENPQGISP